MWYGLACFDEWETILAIGIKYYAVISPTMMHVWNLNAMLWHCVCCEKYNHYVIYCTWRKCQYLLSDCIIKMRALNKPTLEHLKPKLFFLQLSGNI